MIEGETEKQKQKRKQDRRGLVADLFYKGFKAEEIASKLGVKVQSVREDLKIIRQWLNRKTIKKLEYRKNQSIAKIELAQRKAWGIFEANGDPTVKLGAQRVVVSLLELEAKVEGVIAERVVGGAEAQAAKLLDRLMKIDQEAKAKGNGHKEGESLPDAKQGSEARDIQSGGVSAE